MVSGKPPTIRDVASRAKVSIATVSNVLANRKSVNPALVDRVRAAVKDLRYQPDRAASQLRSGRSRVVAVLVPSLENPFFTSIIASIERHLRRDGYDIVIASSNDQEDVECARLATLLSWRPQGVVIVPCTDAFASRSMLQGASVPFVVVDRVVEEISGVDVVGVDNHGAGALAADHLVKLNHRNVLVFASSLKLANIRQRLAGIRRVFSRAGLPEPAILDAGYTFEMVAERLEGWLSHHRCPTGVIALTNFVTLGVVSALSDLSIGIPDQVSLVGFDDYVWMRATTPPLTAIRQPVDHIGAEAVKLLQSRLQGDDSPPTAVRLACEMVERASTRRLGRSGPRPERRTKHPGVVPVPKKGEARR
jgi:DNA-binding LacI/PurR family transcriptional regulator